MEKPELLTYMKQVMDLETALYANQRLSDGLTESVKAHMPVPPQKPRQEIIEMPYQPEAPKSIKHPLLAALLLCVMGILSIIFALLCFEIGGFFNFIGGICALATGIGFIIGGVKTPGESKKESAEYIAAMEHYNKEVDAYKKRSTEAEARNREREQAYQAAMENYDKRLEMYKDTCKKAVDDIFRAHEELNQALIIFYHLDVIYPKYRNLIAVTTIYEYLASGRCDTLEGADGAYNLYEMELRQNIIIGQISSVLDSLEQIKSNQFTLYNEIKEANQKTADLLSNVADNTKFSAYANEETAKANAIIAQNTEATKYYTAFNAAKKK